MSEHNKDRQLELTVIDCGEILDIRRAEEFKTGLINALELGKPVLLNSKKIERIDTTGLQILCTFLNDAKAQGINVEWDSPATAIKEAAQLTGLTNSLSL